LSAPTLLAIPNFSEGRDLGTLDAIATSFTRAGAQLLDLHTDPDHNRAVPGALAGAVADAARIAVERIDVRRHQGVHPFVGAVDVAPIVYLGERERGAACAEALVLADLLGSELELPVFLYGALGGGRTRAELRRGGPAGLEAKLRTGELKADFGTQGPRGGLHPTAGAALVAARPPLVAFNIELEPPAGEAEARQIAAAIREPGLASVRAIGLWLEHEQVAQVSTNIEDHTATPLKAVVEAVARHAKIRRAELVGLAPRQAFEGFPADVPMVEPPRLIEDALNL